MRDYLIRINVKFVLNFNLLSNVWKFGTEKVITNNSERSIVSGISQSISILLSIYS